MRTNPGSSPRRRSGSRGYVLLEIIIALTVFAIVVTGLATVLHSSLDSSNLLRRQATVRRGLEAILIEARQKPKREEMVLTERDDALGMEYRSELEEMKWVDRKGRPIRGIYRLRATAVALRGANAVENSAEVYVYRP